VKIGFLVNPIAGMGGRVGLKGTDGVAEEALRRGAEPLAPQRARECAEAMLEGAANLEFLTCSGLMGADCLEGLTSTVVYACGKKTAAEDTLQACAKFMESGAGLIMFSGGDGTARDVYSAVGAKIPVIGIPAGVKMHSAVFAVNPEAAGRLALEFAAGGLGLRDAEVVDVDEEAYRGNILKTVLYGYMKTPDKPELVQAMKEAYQSVDDDESKFSISVFAGEFMSDGSAYILGAGSTTKAIAERLGVEKTLLGVDVVKEGRLLLKDAGEKELLALLDTEPKVKIIVSPIGAQGFVFGRGTQQISPKVIRKVGVRNIIYVATPHKLNSVPHLLVDTGEGELDRELSGYRSVVMGYRMSQRKDVKTATG
jgi:predicted polyphosphate/ATP-dependent NAD kinase